MTIRKGKRLRDPQGVAPESDLWETVGMAKENPSNSNCATTQSCQTWSKLQFEYRTTVVMQSRLP